MPVNVNLNIELNKNRGVFSGLFNMTEAVNSYYDDYSGGSISTLSIATSPVLGSLSTVRIRGGSLATNAIPATWATSTNSEGITTDVTKWNELTILYVNANDIRIVNKIVFAQSNLVSDIDADYMWHQLNFDTTNASNVTLSEDSLVTTPYNMENVGTPTQATENGNECVRFDSSGDYLRTIDTSLESIFQSTFSVFMQIKLSDGQPSVIQYLCSYYPDITNRFWVDLRTDGKLTVGYTANGTSVFAQTASAVFSNGAMADFANLAIVVPSGGTMQVYLDGVLQPLSVSFPGDMSAVTMANFSGSDNINIGWRDSTAGVGVDAWIRNFIVQPVAYSAGNLSDLATL